jgi:hypothetical protein
MDARDKYIGLKRDALTGQVGNVMGVERDASGHEVIRLRLESGAEVTRTPLEVLEYHDHINDRMAE